MNDNNFNNVIDNFSKHRILMHATFWVVYVVFYSLLWGSYDGFYQKTFFIESTELFFKLPAIYFLLYPLINQSLFKGKYVRFFTGLLITLALTGLVNRAVWFYVYYPLFFPERLANGYFDIIRIVRNMINLNSLFLFFIAIKSLKKWYNDQQTNKALEREKLEAELKFLKSQVHPHFLFNTLNNLYSLTLKKSDNAPEVVLKLSDLMSYMLYDANARWVPVRKEIKYIQDYIDLEKVRYGHRLDIDFNVQGDLNGSMIAPMLMLPFVENSFKHGVSGELEKVWVSIDLTLKDSRLVLKVENSKANEEQSEKHDSYRKGIGLKNVKRRLELIYSNRYDLKIFNEADTFLVVLKLDLHEAEGELKEKVLEATQTVSTL